MTGLREALDWMSDAACYEMPAEIFFPEPEDGPAPALLAKRVCALCPVRDECHQYAMDEGIEFGIWGGQSGRQRIALGMKVQRLPDVSPHGAAGAVKRHYEAGEPLCDACSTYESGRQHDKCMRPWGGVREVECAHGHLLDEENTYYEPNGRPRCRICRRGSELRRPRNATRTPRRTPLLQLSS